MKPKDRDIVFLTSAVRPEHYPPALTYEVVFVGRSNVGKSSLLNTLFGNRHLARVSATPGKTRLLNFFQWNHCLLVDVPGYGFAHGPKEERHAWRAMMDAYFAARRPLPLVFILIDSRHELSPLDETMIDYVAAHGLSYCMLLTKWDMLSQADKSKQTRYFNALWPQAKQLSVSAKTRLGIDAVWKVLYAHCAA